MIFGQDRRLRRKLSIVLGLVVLAALLGACGGSKSKPDAGTPVAPGSASAPAAPDWEKIRASMAEGLVPDRKNARHTKKTIARQSEDLDAPARASTKRPR